MNSIWIALLITAVTCCDALRDRWVDRKVEWWQWHIVKWIAFYTPLVTLTILFIPLVYWPVLVASNWILWRLIYRYNAKESSR